MALQQLGRATALTSAGPDPQWKTLEHSGVLFPPEYEAHGIKMKYKGQSHHCLDQSTADPATTGKPVTLPPEEIGRAHV